MKKKSWPIIKQRINPGGSTTWMVDCGMMNGRRERFFFKTKAEAETKAEQLKVARKNEGVAAFAIPERLRIEAMQCAELLAPHGISLLDAVKAFLPHLQAQSKTVPLDRLVDEFLPSKRADGASGRYLQDLTNKLDCFKVSFGTRATASIASHEVDDWLRKLTSHAGKPVSPVTRNNFRRVLVVLFNFAKRRKYCLENPAVDTDKAKEVEQPVGILSVSQIASMLQKSPDDLVPFLAIAAFAGLRRSELQRLDWSEIDLESNLIQVTAAKAKSARRRLVKIRPNLAGWLKKFVRSSGAVVPDELQALFHQARKKAGIDPWPHNALRHSFASYALAHENNAPALALELGHSNTQMMFQHYREVVKPKDAALYWKILPKRTRHKSGNVRKKHDSNPT